MNTKGKTDRKGASSIDRRAFVKTSVAGALAAASVAKAPGLLGMSQSAKPNFLILLTDQQHLDTIGAGGCPYVSTPAMDKLVNRGVSFRESYSSNPVCSPARSVIFTGRTSTETGVTSNQKRIRSDIPNMGQWFSENSDYETLYAGKWHLPNNRFSSIQGFNVLSAGLGGPGFLGDATVSTACGSYLRQRKSSDPFLMVASFLQPHDICEWLRLNLDNPGALPYPELEAELPPLPASFEYDPAEPEYLKRQRSGLEPAEGKWSHQHWRYYLWSYYRHIEMVDAEIGKVLRDLEASGQDRNTVVLLIADHGEGLAGQQMVRKSNPYDGASKVPFVVSGPGRIVEGRADSRTLVSHVDIVPTLCDLAGISAPPRMRGHSLKSVLEGGSSSDHDFIVTEMPGDRARLVRTRQFKFITYDGDPVQILFDRDKNPAETVNVAAKQEYQDDLKEHQKLLKDWEEQLDPAPDVPNPNAWWRKA